MRCANKAFPEAAARMRTAGVQVNQDSKAGVSSPAGADKQPATPNVSDASGHAHADSSYAALATGGSTM